MLVAEILLQVALCGCSDGTKQVSPVFPVNHSPVINSLSALPDSIGPSDSTVVICSATDPDGDSLVYDWETDARLNIQGEPNWNKFFNNQTSPRCTFYNANLPNPINDSAWVYCSARDPKGGGVGRHVFVILRRPSSSPPPSQAD